MKEYYYERNGQRGGPVSAGQLKKLAAAGEVSPTNLVWTEGLLRWIPAAQLKGLFATKAEVALSDGPTAEVQQPTAEPAVQPRRPSGCVIATLATLALLVVMVSTIGVGWYLSQRGANNKEVNNREAEQWFRQGMEAYLKVPAHPPSGLKQLHQAAEQGHELANAWVGYILCSDMGGDANRDEGLKRIKTALPAIRRMAEQGDTEACVLLGRLYAAGLGVEKDDQEAVRWVRKAADQGNAFAMFDLGSMYQEGRCVAKDYQEALRWYRKAADLGQPRAMLNLGFLYQEGGGVARDYQEALRWYRKAADLGHSMAMNNLASMYKEGEGVARDYQEAIRWYRKAADLGNATAMNNLGRMYGQGTGVARNDDEARQWFIKAAELGDADAMHNLGVMYENGFGVTKNNAEALRWYKQAAELGHQGAQRAVRRLQDVSM